MNWVLKKGIKLFDYFVEKTRVKTYLLWFLGIVIFYAIAYFFLTPHAHGLAGTGVKTGRISFWTSLYFSVVTISSLGYGDLQPIGLSKIFACTEVLIGLALMGVAIAKLTSRRLSYHVQRLFSAELQKGLDGLSSQLETVVSGYREIISEMGTLTIPRNGQGLARNKFIGKVSRYFERASFTYQNIHEYISYEVEQEGDYFGDVPDSAVRHLGRNIDANVLWLEKFLDGVPSSEKADIISSQTMAEMISSFGVLIDVVELIGKNSSNREIQGFFDLLLERATFVNERYFVTPISEEEEMPDQTITSDYEYLA